MRESDFMEFIYNFWVEMCPFFQGYEFIYVFLVILSILAMIEMFIVVPFYLLFGGNNKIWND